MTYNPIAKGTQNWDVPLNAALAQLDSNITSGASSALQATNNLSDLTNIIQARTNLGISQGVVAGVNQFNVKDYGAVGNGVADDTTAIASTIAAAVASAYGGTVFFPPGDYLVNSGTGFSISTASVLIMGAGPEASSIVIGSGFTGTSLLNFTKDNGAVKDISIDGANQSSTTANPVAHAVTVTGAGAFKVLNSTFTRINGYCVRAIGTATNTLHGGLIHDVKMQSSAGGVFIQSDSTNTAANFMISNLFTRFMGVASGGSANLDCIHIEDSWDVLLQNCFTWMQATLGGTGAALRVKGNCAATFIQNLDALGPQTGTNVVIESGVNGDPQNVQIAGGVIQQGGVGLSITGGANQIRVRNMRILNNQTHNIVVSSNGSGGTGGIYFDECAISQGGAGATGTNYDINWTGTAEGFITDCRFGSPIVTVGTAGVQGVVNITSAVVRADNINFAGTGTLATNIFPGIFPQYLLRADLTNAEWRGNLDMRLTGSNRLSLRADTASSNALAFNVAGTATTDNFRILGDGSMQWGNGTAARDTNVGRSAAGILYTDKNMLIGSATALGDNGVGEIQLANAATPPTSAPTGGTTMFSQTTRAIPVMAFTPDGFKHSVVDAVAVASSNQTTTSTAQQASTQLVIALETSATYIMQGSLVIQTPSGVNFTHSFTGPTGATMVWGDATATSLATITTVDTWSGTGANKTAMITGVLVTAGTAGNLTVTFASGTSGQTATLGSQSYIRLTRIK
jgi:hypothetical protein